MDGPEDEDILGLPVMTKAELQKAALEHSGYSTPHLNDILCELCIVRYYAIVAFLHIILIAFARSLSRSLTRSPL